MPSNIRSLKYINRLFDQWWSKQAFDEQNKEKIKAGFLAGVTEMNERFAGYDEAINIFFRSVFCEVYSRNTALKEFKERLSAAKKNKSHLSNHPQKIRIDTALHKF
jgi:hypothetical protein